MTRNQNNQHCKSNSLFTFIQPSAVAKHFVALSTNGVSMTNVFFDVPLRGALLESPVRKPVF